MIRFVRVSLVLGVLVGAVLLAGCSKESETKAPALHASNLPDSYWLKAAPAGAKPVAEVREKAKTGESVVVTGRVGGAKEPFTSGAAAFTLVDAALPPCKDDCESPWDYCCEPQDKLTKHTITVEFREKDSVLKMPARGFHGLDHLKTVVVSGDVKKDDAGNVIVVAKGIHVAD
jgi:hypothetical protein